MDPQRRKFLGDFGLTNQDLAWFDSFGWEDSRVPEPRLEELPDFRRREAALNASIAPLSYNERGASLEGHLAAAIGARCADAQDRASGDIDS